MNEIQAIRKNSERRQMEECRKVINKLNETRRRFHSKFVFDSMRGEYVPR